MKKLTRFRLINLMLKQLHPRLKTTKPLLPQCVCRHGYNPNAAKLGRFAYFPRGVIVRPRCFKSETATDVSNRRLVQRKLAARSELMGVKEISPSL